MVAVEEKDFVIVAPARLPAGDVTLTVLNQGPVRHELIIVRSVAGTLPLRSDGTTANEEALAPVTVEALEPAPAGAFRQAHLHLAPGIYELFCNMDGHYRAGMHTQLTVY